MLPVRPRKELLETCRRRNQLPNSDYLDFSRFIHIPLYYQHIYSKMISKIIYIIKLECQIEKLAYEHKGADQYAFGELDVNKYLQGHNYEEEHYNSNDTSSNSILKDFLKKQIMPHLVINL